VVNPSLVRFGIGLYNSNTMAAKKPLNPFYPLLVIAGTAFCITACAYGLLAMRALRPARPDRVAAVAPSPDGAVERPHPLFAYLERDGEKLLLGELALLALFSFAAMGTDGYWTRRAQVANERLAANDRSAAEDLTKSASSEKQS
jgi:hypothetical protein